MEIEYKIQRKLRRKTLCISISADNKVLVKANNSISEKTILAFIKDKQSWINKILKFNKNIRAPFIPKQFIDGESFLILGKQCPLFIKKSTFTRIELHEQSLRVDIPECFINKPDYIKNKLINWYKCSVYEVLFKRVNIYKNLLQVNVREIMIRNLKRTWANCSSRGVLTFSWRLLMAPIEIVDYVVVHELVHLIYPNHSSKFWLTVQTIKPDYKQSKAWLKINENSMLW